jgi:hypothetical protein
MNNVVPSFKGGTINTDSNATPGTLCHRGSSGEVTNTTETVQTLIITGSVFKPIATVTTNYSVGVNDYDILADATSAAFAITLPASSGFTNRELRIKKIDSAAHNVTITPTGGDTIDGAASKVISTQWVVVTLHTDGTGKWFIMGN